MVHSARSCGGAEQARPGLGPAVEFPFPGRPLPPLAVQGGVEALFDEPLPEPLDGGGERRKGRW